MMYQPNYAKFQGIVASALYYGRIAHVQLRVV